METPDHGQNIITRGLPKTGQVTLYQVGDDGAYEAGWWRGRLNANNRERWIAKTIGGDDIVVDRATGLMWTRNGDSAGGYNGVIINWINGINYANGLTFAGFSDWRIPNIIELASLLRSRGAAPLIHQPPFVNIKENYYWTSTTLPYDTTEAVRISFAVIDIYNSPKSEANYILCVRNLGR